MVKGNNFEKHREITFEDIFMCISMAGVRPRRLQLDRNGDSFNKVQQ